MSDRSERKDRADSSDHCVVNSDCGHPDQSVLGILSEVGVFGPLYWNGMDLCTGFYPDPQ